VPAAETVEPPSPVQVADEVSPRPEPEITVESAPAEAPAAAAPLAAAAPIAVPPVTAPLAAEAPILVPPAVAPVFAPEPMPVDDLRPVLEQAGLTLVQTEPTKLADVLARFASEPKATRVPRERPVLPPLDAGPLVQVETRQGSAPAQH